MTIHTNNSIDSNQDKSMNDSINNNKDSDIDMYKQSQISDKSISDTSSDDEDIEILHDNDNQVNHQIISVSYVDLHQSIDNEYTIIPSTSTMLNPISLSSSTTSSNSSTPIVKSSSVVVLETNSPSSYTSSSKVSSTNENDNINRHIDTTIHHNQDINIYTMLNQKLYQQPIIRNIISSNDKETPERWRNR